MSPIASNVVSYEHDTPLAYHGVDAVRAICKAGFDNMPDTFRWDVPDLRIVVRDDVAITWGLNRMIGPGIEMWSRGTRVFQRMAGRWQMIHQHVSFPYDSATGAAKLDLHPPTAPREH
jgi:ketosteroid isomerase-like protein